MGKMKGNRLNTAANIGTFVTSRQQLNVQRTLVEQNAIQAELAAAQLAQIKHQQLTAEYQRLCQWADAEVTAGRRSREDANDYVAGYWHNLTTAAPQAAAESQPNSANFWLQVSTSAVPGRVGTTRAAAQPATGTAKRGRTTLRPLTLPVN